MGARASASVLRFRGSRGLGDGFFGGVLVDGVLGLGERTLDYIAYVLI